MTESKVVVTLPWLASEATNAFLLAMGSCRTRLRHSIDAGAFGLGIYIMPSQDTDVMRQRVIRAGRALADEAQRKRLKVFMMQDVPEYSVQASSKERGVALRVSMQWNLALGDFLYRVDMLGARR